MRNADVADELVLSPRTVDHHVSAILRKLRVKTRGEAAAAATRWDLVAPLAGSKHLRDEERVPAGSARRHPRRDAARGARLRADGQRAAKARRARIHRVRAGVEGRERSECGRSGAVRPAVLLHAGSQPVRDSSLLRAALVDLEAEPERALPALEPAGDLSLTSREGAAVTWPPRDLQG